MVTINNSYPISIQLANRETTLFPRCRIYYNGTTEITQSPIDLAHVSGGVYSSSDFIPDVEGYYTIQVTVFSSNLYSGKAVGYGSSSETIKVDSTEGEIAYISSNLEVFGYGGGGGKGDTYVVPGGKSPWTHKQRDEIIDTAKTTKELLQKVDKEVKKYHDEQLRAVDNLSKGLMVKIDVFMDIISNIKRHVSKSSDKEDISNVIRDVNNVINILMGYKEILKKASTSEEVMKVMNKVDEADKIITQLLTKQLSDEDLEDLKNILEEEKNG